MSLLCDKCNKKLEYLDFHIPNILPIISMGECQEFIFICNSCLFYYMYHNCKYNTPDECYNPHTTPEQIYEFVEKNNLPRCTFEGYEEYNAEKDETIIITKYNGNYLDSNKISNPTGDDGGYYHDWKCTGCKETLSISDK